VARVGAWRPVSLSGGGVGGSRRGTGGERGTAPFGVDHAGARVVDSRRAAVESDAGGERGPDCAAAGLARAGGGGGGVVFEALRQRHPDAFVVADDYQVASQLAFYMPGSPRVYCVQAAMGDRRSQYDVWANPLRDVQDFRGRACLYVGRIRPELSEGESAPFPGLTRDRVVEHMVRGARMAVWSISHCEAFAGFREEFAGDSPKY
jgi:hypothetical protein